MNFIWMKKLICFDISYIILLTVKMNNNFRRIHVDRVNHVTVMHL